MMTKSSSEQLFVISNATSSAFDTPRRFRTTREIPVAAEEASIELPPEEGPSAQRSDDGSVMPGVPAAPPPSPLRGEGFTILSADAARGLERHSTSRFQFQVPARWKPPIAINPYAEKIERMTLKWFIEIGCSPEQLDVVRKFKPGHYVGIPFPLTAPDKTLQISKYLSLWLLWDDLDIESCEHRWRIRPEHVYTEQLPPGMTMFDAAWLQLFREFAQTRSPEWIEMLCQTMALWSDAARTEAAQHQRHQETFTVPSFKENLERRIATIGMYATVHLLENAYDFELPRSFHQHPIVGRLKTLANKIVGLGNDILSFGKDHVNGQVNLASTLMRERGLSVEDAIAYLVQMHNDALAEYDRLATALPRWPTVVEECFIQRWLEDVRYASLGFSIWESSAPRYTAHKILTNGKIIEPTFVYLPPKVM